MPSPFPGMNPYLEQEDAWHDFHERFMPMAAAMLEKQVGDDYIVKIDETVWPIGLRSRLPAIPIPLREPDRLPRLDLQRLLNRI